jgi:hypothetical protein
MVIRKLIIILPNQWLYSRTIRLYALDQINNVFLWDSAVF